MHFKLINQFSSTIILNRQLNLTLNLSFQKKSGVFSSKYIITVFLKLGVEKYHSAEKSYSKR